MGESFEAEAENEQARMGRKERIVDVTPLVLAAVTLAKNIEALGPENAECGDNRNALLILLKEAGIGKEDFKQWPKFQDCMFDPGTTERISEEAADVEMLSHLTNILGAKGVGVAYEQGSETERVED